MAQLLGKALLSKAEGFTTHPKRLDLNLSSLNMKALFSKKHIVKRKLQYNIE
jgi:hypothetical protein